VIVVVVVVIVAIVVVAIGAALIMRARRPDTVEVFQRQIDALSPEARKPVVEQIQQLDDRGEDDGTDAPGGPAEEDQGGA
jgi:hypothetical protein